MLQGDLAGEPVRLDGADEVAARLNAAPDPRPHVPEGCLYAAAGFENKGILQTILRDMAARFPRKAPPQFPGIVPGSFVAYAYLEAGLKFTIPYFQNDKPLVFTAGDGAKTEINSFGIREKDDYAYRELRAQARVIYHEGGLDGPEARFAVDLCGKSEPSQVVVARIPRPADLLAAVESIERNLGRTGHGIGINDVLLVPDIFWRLSHRFAGLEGRRFGNKRLDGQRIDVAQQDILFRLDRSGAELASEAKTYMLPEPTHFTFDRPFLVYMKKRGEKMPYFAMWVDNAELLRKW
jgi:hypothetical protein